MVRGTLVTLALVGCAVPTPRPCTRLAEVLGVGDVLIRQPAPTVAGARGLSREWQELEQRIGVLEGMLRDPGLLRWPFPPDQSTGDERLSTVLAEAAEEAGVEVRLDRVDCVEYPCVAFGELADRDALEALLDTDAMDAARRRSTLSVSFTPPEEFRRNRWRDVDRVGFGVAFYDEGPASEMIEWRLRQRAEAFWAEEEGAAAPVMDADAGDASAVAEELLGVRATQKILEMALVDSPDPVWPFPELERYRPEAVVAAVARAIDETGVSAVVYVADCQEYPCLLIGEVAEVWQLERILAATALESYLSTGYRWLLLRPVDALVRRSGEQCRAQTFTLALYLTSNRALMVRRISARAGAYWQTHGGVREDSRTWTD